MQNPYVPYPVEVIKIVTEVDTKDIKTFRFAFLNKEDEEKFRYTPGQFGELSIFGKGESPIGIASSPTQKGYVEFTVQKAGVVTSALHEMEEGTRMGLRGPLGIMAHRIPGGQEHRNRGGGFAFTTWLPDQLMIHGDSGTVRQDHRGLRRPQPGFHLQG
jgi:hypothetical protein